MARFTFTADAPATFQCSLDGGVFAACSSPFTAGPLSLGAHRFSVRAVDAAGVADPSPQVRNWTVVPSISAPVVTVTRPAGRRTRARALRGLAGTARAPSGVTLVEVALQRGGPDASFFPPRCRYVELRTGRTAMQPCVLPPYVIARGTTRWQLTVPAAVRRALRPGRYQLIVRALNVLHNGGPQRFTLTVTR